MTDYSKKFRVAAVQAESVWNDLDGGIDKLSSLSREAKDGGADLVAFPEVWLPGYPWFLWLDSVAWQSQFVLPYALNSLEIGGPQWRRIENAAAEMGIAIAFGYSGGYQMVCVRGEVHLEGEHHGDHGYQSGARGASSPAEGAR